MFSFTLQLHEFAVGVSSMIDALRVAIDLHPQSHADRDALRRRLEHALMESDRLAGDPVPGWRTLRGMYWIDLALHGNSVRMVPELPSEAGQSVFAGVAVALQMAILAHAQDGIDPQSLMQAIEAEVKDFAYEGMPFEAQARGLDMALEFLEYLLLSIAASQRPDGDGNTDR